MTPAYLDAVDARLADLVRVYGHDVGAMAREAEGIDPILISERLARLGGVAHEQAAPQRSLSTIASLPAWQPELHPLDFEWYFTRACAAGLVERLVRPGDDVLCLGAPTVAFALVEDGRFGRLTLLDKNPLAFERGPTLALERRVEDLATAALPDRRYDVAIFDAPWYLPALIHWLHRAACAVRPGGTVAFALHPRLLRPLAAVERQQVLAACHTLGLTRVEPCVLDYDSPTFEREALAAAGLVLPSTWRRADLVVLTRKRDIPRPRTYTSTPEVWQTFVVGPQVLKLRMDLSGDPSQRPLEPITRRADFRYASISTRDPQRPYIGLWSSRSRVARVYHGSLVAEALLRLEATLDYAALDDLPALGTSRHQRVQLVEDLRIIVGPLGSS